MKNTYGHNCIIPDLEQDEQGRGEKEKRSRKIRDNRTLRMFLLKL
jgi:hypothetical protein